MEAIKPKKRIRNGSSDVPSRTSMVSKRKPSTSSSVGATSEAAKAISLMDRASLRETKHGRSSVCQIYICD
jgi:hypothetical protein